MEATSTANAVNGWIPLDIEFAGLDPRWYADELSQLTLPLDQAPLRQADDESVGALLCAPADRGIADPGDRPGWITNHGNVAAWPSIRVHGPVTHPRIWNTVTGRVLELDLSLRAGESVEIETRPGTRWALRNGVTNVAGDLTPASRLEKFVIPPGRSEIAWTADDPTGTSRLDVSWRSAYTAL
jgi:Phage tail protein